MSKYVMSGEMRDYILVLGESRAKQKNHNFKSNIIMGVKHDK